MLVYIPTTCCFVDFTLLNEIYCKIKSNMKSLGMHLMTQYFIRRNKIYVSPRQSSQINPGKQTSWTYLAGVYIEVYISNFIWLTRLSSLQPVMGLNDVLNTLVSLAEDNVLSSWSVFQEQNGQISVKIRFEATKESAHRRVKGQVQPTRQRTTQRQTSSELITTRWCASTTCRQKAANVHTVVYVDNINANQILFRINISPC